MPKKYINRDWRNWNDSGKGAGAKKPAPLQPKKAVRLSGGFEIPASFTGNMKQNKNIKPPMGSFPNNFNSKILYSKLFGGYDAKHDLENEYENDMEMGREANFNASKIEKVQREINLGKAKSAFDLERGLKIRRLSTVLANVISKLAEDQICEPIPGDEEWNIDDLLMRRITKMPVNSCRQSRERSNIVLMLDSSPSCSDEAAFYSSLAIGAVGMNVLDVYDAPNCKVIRKFDYKTKRFKEFMSKEEISAGIKGWDYIKGRTVLFFGDYDGTEEMIRESNHNKVYWFNPVFGNDDCDDDFYLGDDNYGKFLGNIYRCENDKDFIEILKKLK